jgi:hypothetical protein
MLTKSPTDNCYGKGVIQRNFDFRQAPNLSGLRDTIADSYRVDLTFDGPCDRAEIFVKR